MVKTLTGLVLVLSFIAINGQQRDFNKIQKSIDDAIRANRLDEVQHYINKYKPTGDLYGSIVMFFEKRYENAQKQCNSQWKTVNEATSKAARIGEELGSVQRELAQLKVHLAQYQGLNESFHQKITDLEAALKNSTADNQQKITELETMLKNSALDNQYLRSQLEAQEASAAQSRSRTPHATPQSNPQIRRW